VLLSQPTPFNAGFCTADQIKSLQGLLTTTPNPTDEEILRAVTGNRCRVMLPTSF
jgi:aerobic-type carbon monoxide dehydrogenase small subunit (CoxS/CutS family)